MNKEEIHRRMDGAIDSMIREFDGLRTGRASSGLLEGIKVESYGTLSPLNQVASVSVPEPRLLSVQVWDKSMIKPVEKAIRESGLGLNPIAEGQTIRVPVPPLTEQRRADLSKVAAKYAEEAKVSIRNVRRDGMDSLKSQEKAKEISQDDHRRLADEVQKATDTYIKKIEDLLTAKQKEIIQI